MCNRTEDKLSASTEGLFGGLQKSWRWLLALGILFIVLGSLGFWMTFGLTLASVLFFGWLLIISGGFQLFNAFKSHGWKSMLWHVLIGILYIVAGFLIFVDPIVASATLTLFLAYMFIVAGVFRAFAAIQLRSEKEWVWPLVSGLISVILGCMILARWPASGFWVIGLFVAIELIFSGWAYVAIALAARRRGAEKTSASLAAEKAAEVDPPQFGRTL